MKKELFNKLTSNLIDSIDLVTLNELNIVKEKFPYCEIIHNILLLKSHQKSDLNFREVLTTTSLYSTDRRNLYNRIHPVQKIKKNNKPSTIQNFEEWLGQTSKKKDNTIPKKIKKSVEDNDYLTTETLAEIYVEQGYYERAIQAYQILCLKYPKKSGLFANRIEDIKNKKI